MAAGTSGALSPWPGSLPGGGSGQGALPIPGYRALQAFFKAHGRTITQVFLRQGDVGKRVLDIAGALRTVLHGAMVAGDSPQQGDGLVEAGLVTSGDVENAAHHLGSRGSARQQVGGYGVLHKGEIAALFAIAEDGGLLPDEHEANDAGEHA